MKFLQEVRGYELVTNRRPPSQLSDPHALQLRGRGHESRVPAKRKLPITVHPTDVSNTPRPVKILRVAVR